MAVSLTEKTDSTSWEELQDPELTTPPTSTTYDSGLNFDKKSSATHQALNPVPMDIDQEIEEEASNIITVAAPAWLSVNNMDVYLRNCSKEKAWHNLVQSFYRFEEGNG